MSDKDHIRTLYELMAERQKRYDQKLQEYEIQNILLSKKLQKVELMFSCLNITFDMLDSYHAFIADTFVEDPSGNSVEPKKIFIAYRDWNKYNPGRTIIARAQMNVLFTLSPIGNKKIKESDTD